jgi:hypothetical protein
MEIEALTLENIAQGAAHEIFAHLVEQVVKNISDPNTNAEAERRFRLEFVFKPFADRSGAQVQIRSESKLQSVQTVMTTMFIGREKGKPTAYSNDPGQTQLFGRDEGQKPQ